MFVVLFVEGEACVFLEEVYRGLCLVFSFACHISIVVFRVFIFFAWSRLKLENIDSTSI